MKKHHSNTKICKLCHAKKPLADFLLSAAGYLKKYGSICHACRLKQHKKASKVAAEDEDEGGKGGGLKIDYNAKLFETLRQEEKKEAIEEAKKEAHEETDELEALKEQEKQETAKEAKSRTTKSLIERLANLLSRKKSTTDSIVTDALYTLYKTNSIVDGITSAGAIKSLGPEWGKRMADFRRFSGINALVSLNVGFTAFSGKITEAAGQGNELIQEAKRILDPTMSRR